MTAAIAHLQSVADECITAHGGVRPIEQGEGDSFVAAFTRASDAGACALDLQRAPLAPIRLRIGVHTGEVQLRDDANYAGPTINRTARLRDSCPWRPNPAFWSRRTAGGRPPSRRCLVDRVGYSPVA